MAEECFSSKGGESNLPQLDPNLAAPFEGNPGPGKTGSVVIPPVMVQTATAERHKQPQLPYIQDADVWSTISIS